MLSLSSLLSHLSASHSKQVEYASVTISQVESFLATQFTRSTSSHSSVPESSDFGMISQPAGVILTSAVKVSSMPSMSIICENGRVNRIVSAVSSPSVVTQE